MLTTQNIDPNQRQTPRFFLVRWIIGFWHWMLPPSLAHMDRESDFSRRLRAGVIIGGCLVAMVLAAYFGKPMVHGYREYEASGYVKDAIRARDNNDIPSAIINAQRAFNKAPDYEPAIRLNAELLTTIGRTEALVFWDRLERKGAASLADQEGKVRALLRNNAARDAKLLLEQLIRDHPDEKELMALAEEVIGGQQATQLGLDALRKYCEKHPDDADSALRLARFQLVCGRPDEIKKGMATLWVLSAAPEQLGLDAIRLLSQRDGLEVSERSRLANLLDLHPLADGEDHTAAMGLRLALSPDRREQLIDETSYRWFKEAKGKDLVPLIRWLVLNREFSRVVTLINVEDIKLRKDDELLLQNYLTALTWLGRMSELETLVNDEQIPVTRAVRSFYQAILSATKALNNRQSLDLIKAGRRPADVLTAQQRDEIKQKLLSAIASASNEGRLDMLLQIAEYCTGKLMGFFEIAEDAYRTVATSGNRRLEHTAFDGWLKCERLACNTEGLGKAAAKAVNRWPEDRGFQEEYLYACLLQGDRIEGMAAKAQQLLATNPEDSTRKLVCALGFFRLGDMENSIAACQRIDLGTIMKASPGQIAVFAAIVLAAGPDLVAAGNKADFRSSVEAILANTLDERLLLPEEAAMLDSARSELSKMRSLSSAN